MIGKLIYGTKKESSHPVGCCAGLAAFFLLTIEERARRTDGFEERSGAPVERTPWRTDGLVDVSFHRLIVFHFWNLFFKKMTILNQNFNFKFFLSNFVTLRNIQKILQGSKSS